MAGFLTMTNLGRIAKVIALLLFVLPWVTVSCADQTLVSMSGVDLATGHISMAANPMGGPSAAAAPSEHGGDLLVIIGAVLILAGIAVTFVLKGSKGAMAAGACAALAAASLAYTVLVRIPGAARHDATTGAGGGGGAGGPSPEQIAEMIKVNIQIGFYLCLAALIAAIVFDFMSMRATPAAAAAAPPAESPPPSV
jgi:hypothetical protein